MCGIAGYWGAFDPELLPRMNQVIAHRGPDGEGLYYAQNQRLGLAHRRLAIVDLSPTGYQPMQSADGRYVIIFNGEIYDYQKLRDELIAAGAQFRGTSDTEVLLQAWILWGVKCLSRLNGIFAFALWDNVSQELFLARDQFGVKPLYYCQDPRGVIFASEIKSILQDPHVDRTLDPRAIRDYLIYIYSPWPRTILQHVRKLEPGSYLRIKEQRVVESVRYAPLPTPAIDYQISESDAADQLRENLKRAVDRQLIADVPVGSFLSGGLDSSAIVAMVKQRQIDCFTISGAASAKEGFVDDLPYARKVADYLKQPLHEIPIRPEMFDDLPKMLWHMDEPQADPAAINVLMISKLAREHGIKVLLSGAAGDDLFTGYRRHFALAQEGWWSWLPRPVRWGMSQVARRLPQKNVLLRRIAKAFQYANRTKVERMLGYFLWADQSYVDSLFVPAIYEEISRHGLSGSLQRTLDRYDPNLPALQQMLLVEQSHFLTDHNLNYTDKLSMAAGVEVRVPFLDRDLAHFAATLPPHLKQNGRTGKYIFKRAMEGLLPQDVIYRPKTGFGIPLRAWMRGPIQLKLRDYLSPESLARRGIFNPKDIKTLWDRVVTGKLDATYLLLSLASIELWCRMFIDKSTPDGSC